MSNCCITIFVLSHSCQQNARNDAIERNNASQLSTFVHLMSLCYSIELNLLVKVLHEAWNLFLERNETVESLLTC